MYDKLIESLLQAGAKKATLYLSEKEIVRAVRTSYGGKFVKGGNLEITITKGRPNYLEREFIKLCKKAGEPFPVKKPQLKFLPTKSRSPQKKV